MPGNAFDSLFNQPGATIKQPGNPQEGSKGPGPTLGASTEPAKLDRIEPTKLPEAPQMQQNQDGSQPATFDQGSTVVPSPSPTPSASPEPAGAPANAFDGLLQSAKQNEVQSAGGAVPNSKAPVGTLENPANVSPLGIMDRLKMSVGNEKGNMNYLRQRFQEVKLDEQQGLLIKDQGVWHKADPIGLQDAFKDAWALTRAIAAPSLDTQSPRDLLDKANQLADYTNKKVLDYGIPAAINIAGTTSAAAEGIAAGAPLGPVGATVGGVIGAFGGGATSGTIRTSLGRLVGTYDATPDQQIKDIGWEGLFSMGGQIINLGTKPTGEGLVKAATYIKNTGSEVSKDAIASTLGFLNGKGKPVMDAIIDEPQKFGVLLNKASSGASNTAQVVNNAADAAINSTKKLLEKGSDALPQRYGQVMNDLIEKSDMSGLKVNFEEHIQNVYKAMESEGLGKVVTSKGGVSFRPLSPQEFLDQSTAGQPAVILQKEAAKQISEIISTLNRFKSLGQVEGKGAARSLIAFNKSLNELTRDSLGNPNVPQSTQRALQITSQAFKDGVATSFENAGLGQEYTQMQALYTKYGNAVQNAKNTLNATNGSETLVKKLVSGAGRNRTANGETALLVELAGDEGKSLLSDIKVNHAVSQTRDLLPNLNLKNMAAEALAGGAAKAVIGTNPLIGGAIAVPTAIGASPKLGARIAQTAGMAIPKVGTGTSALQQPSIDFLLHASNFLRGLTPTALRQLLQSPQAIQQVFHAPLKAGESVDQNAKDLLQKTGVIPNDQQQ